MDGLERSRPEDCEGWVPSCEDGILRYLVCNSRMGPFRKLVFYASLVPEY